MWARVRVGVRVSLLQFHVERDRGVPAIGVPLHEAEGRVGHLIIIILTIILIIQLHAIQHYMGQ